MKSEQINSFTELAIKFFDFYSIEVKGDFKYDLTHKICEDNWSLIYGGIIYCITEELID